MSYTKADIVSQALEEIGYASYIYDVMPEQQESVMRVLDAMFATWNDKGIRVGYASSSSVNGSSLTTVIRIPNGVFEAAYTNLAIRIAPRFGKTVTAETKRAAREGYEVLLKAVAQPIEQQFRSEMPVGQGNKPWRRTNQPFVNAPDEALEAGTDNLLEFE
jgi:hypothetical protein